MSKKAETEDSDKYIEAVTEAIKKAAPSLRELYIEIHGYNPSRQQLQQFRNRLNPTRSNPGIDMIGMCLEHLPQLHDISVKELFGFDGKGVRKKKSDRN